jgi:nucleotide-binding universal stress UspA family protein
VTNTVVLPRSNGEQEQSTAQRSAAILLATDGTPQSDAAIAFAYLLSLKDHSDVIALAVVDHAPIPWGAADPSVVLDYERGQLMEAQRKVTAQIERLGNKRWTIEVRSGDPTTIISAMAKEADAGLLVVGLGGHGPAARFFGNETALRLMRLSATPVLAVDTRMRELPNRVVVAMDFSEASIEAARLALDIVAPGATLTLVHVVPWERKEYVPERWFREHEAYIAAQLRRVAGWLDHSERCRIHQRILYGKPGPCILSCAEELDANLIVAGTHGRSLIGRVLGGETVAKLVRGARRSVLVLPRAAAFRRFETQSRETEALEDEQRLAHEPTQGRR